MKKRKPRKKQSWRNEKKWKEDKPVEPGYNKDNGHMAWGESDEII